MHETYSLFVWSFCSLAFSLFAYFSHSLLFRADIYFLCGEFSWGRLLSWRQQPTDGGKRARSAAESFHWLWHKTCWHTYMILTLWKSVRVSALKGTNTHTHWLQTDLQSLSKLGQFFYVINFTPRWKKRETTCLCDSVSWCFTVDIFYYCGEIYVLCLTQ